MISSQQKNVKNQLCRPKDPKAVLKFNQWLDQIYLEQATFKQLVMNNQFTEFLLPSGQAYTILRQKMQRICIIARNLINNSIAVIFKNDQPCSGQMQAAITIFSDHFHNMMSANKQVCLLWQTNFHSFILKDQILNQLALRQLIPTNLNVPFRRFFEFMPKMFDKMGGQKIKSLHSYITELFQSVQKKEVAELRHQMSKRCEKWKKQIENLIDVKANLEKAIDNSEFHQRIYQAKQQKERGSVIGGDKAQIKTQIRENLVEQTNNKKSKKRRNKKRKKKTQSLDAVSENLDSNQFDDLPDLIAIQKKHSLKNHKKSSDCDENRVKQGHKQINNPISILTKGEAIKTQQQQIWSSSEIELLNCIELFQLQENSRAQCNLSPQYIQRLEKENEQLIKYFRHQHTK